jgi:hypothetical protein
MIVRAGAHRGRTWEGHGILDRPGEAWFAPLEGNLLASGFRAIAGRARIVVRECAFWIIFPGPHVQLIERPETIAIGLAVEVQKLAFGCRHRGAAEPGIGLAYLGDKRGISVRQGDGGGEGKHIRGGKVRQQRWGLHDNLLSSKGARRPGQPIGAGTSITPS